MKRSKHSLSHYKLATFDMGELVPVAAFDVLPGDSIRMATSALLRVSPLMAPVMHPVSVRIHHWYVPWRVLDPNWEDFITGEEGDLPTLTGEQCKIQGNLSDYLGIPPNVNDNLTMVSFKHQAYAKIVDEFYRDQDLQPEYNPAGTWPLFNVAWEKDYFTAARPWTQKGPAITLPLGDMAPVRGIGVVNGSGFAQTSGVLNMDFPNDVTLSVGNPALGPAADVGLNLGILQDPAHAGWPKIYTDLAAATGVDVNDVRKAFALQRYQEARAQYGSRFTEYLRYLGVRSSDARLQRPEYLGGGRSTISFSEVLRTGNTSDDVEEQPSIGEMRGHGISALRTRSFTRFFEEHGTVLTLASIRPRSMYASGVNREFLKSTKEDYWQKELELIGQQDIFPTELYAPSTNIDGDGIANGNFGYQDRYSEYRHIPSTVAGDFRTTLNDWHLARFFGTQPELNSDFIECVPSKRIHAEQTADVIWGMFSHSIQARRLVGKRTIGKII